MSKGHLDKHRWLTRQLEKNMPRQYVLDLIHGYSEWVVQWEKEDRDVYYLTFLFNHLRVQGEGALQIMHEEITRFYNTLLTRVARNPTRKSNQDRLPILIAFPDRPVSKRNGTLTLSQIRPNDGRHFHALVAIPSSSRLQVPLDKHIAENGNLYLGQRARIVEIHVEALYQAPDRVVDYSLKTAKRGLVSTDHILVLPRSLVEL
jgi:hypothetical protein